MNPRLTDSPLNSIRATSAAQTRISHLSSRLLLSTPRGLLPSATSHNPPSGTKGTSRRSQRVRIETPRGATWRQELCPKPRGRLLIVPSLSTLLVHELMFPNNMPPPPVPPNVLSGETLSCSQAPPSSTPALASTSASQPVKRSHPLATSSAACFGREELISNLNRVLGQDCLTLETQELENILDTLQNYQTPSHATSERQTQAETRVHSPEPLSIGAGFYRDIPSDLPDDTRLLGLKRIYVGPSDGLQKRPRVSPGRESTNTEDEEDTPITSNPAAIASSSQSSTTSTSSGVCRRPAGLPTSAARATAGSRSASLPSSSTTSSTEIPFGIQAVPLNTSASPTPSHPTLALGSVASTSTRRNKSCTLAPGSVLSPTSYASLDTTQSLAQPRLDDALSTANIKALLNYSLDLVWQKYTHPEDGAPIDNRATILSGIDALRGRLLSTTLRHLIRILMEPPTLVTSIPDVLPDNEEVLQALSAAAAGNRNKSKPTLRDYTGNMRQVLTSSILDLLAYACAKGPYETKRTMLIWALEATKRVWARELPGIPFNTPDLNALKILAARAATLRGQARDRVRQLVVFIFGLSNPPVNEAERLANEQLVVRLLANAFHCTDPTQPRTNQYEHPVIPRAIALALFHCPDAIGPTYHMYFNPMPLPTVAFALTTVQSCLEEWETGTFKARDLRAEHQYNFYCAHLKGLQRYETVAGSRMLRFRERWFDFAIQYSGAQITTELQTQEITEEEDIRPDTPPPVASSPDL